MEPVSVSNSLLPILWAAKFGSHLSSNMQQHHWPQSVGLVSSHDDSREEAAVKSPRSESVQAAQSEHMMAKSGENGKEITEVLHRLNSSGNGNFLSHLPTSLPCVIICFP